MDGCTSWKKISFYDMAGITAVAYNKVATVDKSVNGFRKCGLWPFNDGILTDDDFVDVTAPKTPSSGGQHTAFLQQIEAEDQRATSSLQLDAEDLQRDTSQQLEAVDQQADSSQQPDAEDPKADSSQQLEAEYQPVAASQPAVPENDRSQTLQTISQDELSTSTCNARRIFFELCSPSQDQTIDQTIGPKPNRVYKHAILNEHNIVHHRHTKNS